jgi:hypothetical protein
MNKEDARLAEFQQDYVEQLEEKDAVIEMLERRNHELREALRWLVDVFVYGVRDESIRRQAIRNARAALEEVQ